MKITDVLVEKTQTPRPRNFVAKNAMKTTSGAGKHKDKKKAAKQGNVKHKGRVAEGMDFYDRFGHDTMPRDHKSEVRALLKSGDIKTALEVIRSIPDAELKTHLRDMVRQHRNKGVAEEGYGTHPSQRVDPRTGKRYVPPKSPLKQGDVKHKQKQFEQGVSEGNEWGEPGELLADVMQTLEREVEWPLTDVMDHSEVQRLLQPVRAAINAKMQTVGEAQGDDWGSMSHSEFKRRELQHELGHEDDPDFERKLREKDRGPWYIKIDGKIYKQKGEPKVFDWKKGANNYALAILKNRPELQGKIVLTKKPIDEMRETATAGSTSAGNVAVGAVYKNKKGRTYKNPDGTAKNALDVKGANLLTGGSIAKR